MSDGEIGEEEIAAALQRLLAWPDIARSGQLAGFLSYIVERKLRGEAQAIKAYSIAVDVFGRPPDFDPQTDPIVRVQARRLRALLSQFYREEGAGEAVRITLPRGGYVPEFVRRPDAAAGEGQPENDGGADGVPAGTGRKAIPAAWYLLAGLTLGLVLLIFVLARWDSQPEESAFRTGLIDPPSILVTDFQSLTGDMTDLGMAAGLAIELVTDLDQFETISVGYGGGAGAVPVDGADFVLSGIVRREAGGLHYSAILTEAATGNVVWNHTIALTSSEVMREDLLNHVSDRLSMMVGGPRGPLHQRARALLETGPDLAGGENLYLCRVLFDLYRETGGSEAGRRVLDCLNGLEAEEARQGQALAALASLIAEGITGPGIAGLDREERLERAEALLNRAGEVAPVSAFVWEQRARLLEAMGSTEMAAAAYSTAVQINPANADAIAARARHLAFLGRPDMAARLIGPVMRDSPDPPPWYFCVPALEALRRGDYDAAVAHAATYAEADRELGPILAVMAGRGLGASGIVNRYLPQVLDLASFRSAGILTRLRDRIADEALLRNIRVSLLSAGVPAAALNGPF